MGKSYQEVRHLSPVSPEYEDRVDEGSDLAFAHLVGVYSREHDAFDVPSYVGAYQEVRAQLMGQGYTEREVEDALMLGTATVEHLVKMERAAAARGELHA